MAGDGGRGPGVGRRLRLFDLWGNSDEEVSSGSRRSTSTPPIWTEKAGTCLIHPQCQALDIQIRLIDAFTTFTAVTLVSEVLGLAEPGSYGVFLVGFSEPRLYLM